MNGYSTSQSSSVKDPRTIARKYQLELCKKAVNENIIVYLGTGCGKTHIAVLLMYELNHLIRKPCEGICIFLAPTVPLVRQQAMVIENCTDFKVRSYYGSSKHLKGHHEWNEEIKQIEVLVMTPQILLQNLRHCFIRMEIIALLIFDECHHAQVQKRHPYAQIMKEFYNIGAPRNPRIFGMTASPIIGKGGSDQLNYTKCINSLESLLDAKVCSVDDKAELESVVASPDVKLYFYGPVEYVESSLGSIYLRKLDQIKHQFMCILREMVRDPKECQKLMKWVVKMHENVVVCVESLGFYGAIQAVQILLSSEGLDVAEMNGDEDNSTNYLAKQYLSSAGSVLSSNLFDDFIRLPTFDLEALEEPFFSTKLSVLIGILSSYRLNANMKCIIFVKRIIVARSLAYLLRSLKILEFWKCEFLVGYHSGLKNMSRKKMNTIVEKFRSGELNLLVATKVAEEGLDIQTCCLVVRYDLPETVASFIQSRGRARMQKSEYIFLAERGNERHEQLLHDFMSGEGIMNEEVIRRSSSNTFDNLNETTYKVSSTGASISTACSISLLYRYCSKLSRDKYFNPLPKFKFEKDSHGTICRISLPPNAPIRRVDSLPCSSKDEAKRSACLNACIKLHKLGALSDYLLPGVDGGKRKGSSNNCSGSNNDNDEFLREELHEMLVPAALKVRWSDDAAASKSMFFYYIKFIPVPEDRNYQAFGLFVKTPIPKEAETMEVDLHLARGRVVKTGFVPMGTITFDKEKILLAQNFQEMFLKAILDRSELFHDFVPLGENAASYQPTTTFYLLLPIMQQRSQESMTIDWPTVRRCLSSPVFFHPTVSCERNANSDNNSLELLNGTFTENDVPNCLVFTPHNRLFFVIDGVLHGTNAHSEHKDAISYAEHYLNKFNIQLAYPEQPFLKAKQLFAARNLLHNRLHESTEARELAEHFVELPPELCALKIFGFSKSIGSSLSLLPSVMHRLQSFLVAVELKDRLSASFPEASKVRAVCILEALTAEKCLERLSLERFEVLGDSFLKYIVGRHSFLSYQGFDEGQLTKKRSSIVNNSHLYELAIRNNLQVYIRDELFHPSNFFALGRPCKLVCDVDTESVIHNQPGNDSTGDGAEANNVKCTKLHRWMHRKTIADVVESLVGAFLVEGGFTAAIAFLRWIGIQVHFEVSDVHRFLQESDINMSLTDSVDINELERLLGYKFKHKGLLLQAFIHPSYNNHSGGCYQKLEFLGDAVLEYLMTSYIFSAYPDLKPGQLTDLRSAGVNNNSFAHIAVRRSLHEYLMKESNSLCQAVNKFKDFVLLPAAERELVEEPACPKVLGDIVESSIGAILLDTGFNLNIVWSCMLSLLESALRFTCLQINPVRELRELCQSLSFELGLPGAVRKREGYFVQVDIDVEGKLFTFSAVNNNSKAARRMAAQEALCKLKSLGFNHKNKSLEEILRFTRKKTPQLIGFDEAPITIENIGDGTIPPEKLSTSDAEETLSKFRLICQLPSNNIMSSWSSRKLKLENDGAYNGNNYQNNLGVPCQKQLKDNGFHQEMNGEKCSKSARSQLFEICAANYWRRPSFECCNAEGPSHLRMYSFKVTIQVEGAESTVLECYSEPKPQKKAAQEHAAVGALWYLKQLGCLIL